MEQRQSEKIIKKIRQENGKKGTKNRWDKEKQQDGRLKSNYMDSYIEMT